jgi:hypothetical protein
MSYLTFPRGQKFTAKLGGALNLRKNENIITTTSCIVHTDILVEHQCGVVVSNYFALLDWRNTTHRVDLDSVTLMLERPPQRMVTNEPVLPNTFFQANTNRMMYDLYIKNTPIIGGTINW